MGIFTANSLVLLLIIESLVCCFLKWMRIIQLRTLQNRCAILPKHEQLYIAMPVSVSAELGREDYSSS